MEIDDSLAYTPFFSGELGLVSLNGAGLWERAFGEIGAGFRISTGGKWSLSNSVTGKLEGDAL